MYEQMQREQHNTPNQTNTGDVRVQMGPQIRNIPQTSHQDVRIDNVTQSVGLSENQSVIQGRLFIRGIQETINKSDSDMMNLDPSIADAAKKDKIPQYVSTDPGYFEIENDEDVIAKLLDGLHMWLEQNNEGSVDLDEDAFEELFGNKIIEMIEKTVESADPSVVYNKYLEGTRKVPRLKQGEQKWVSYYFESLEDFYMYLCLSIKGRYDQSMLPGKTMNNQPNLWLKINVVNTGAGDAIVITLPKGYLILDLGTNLIILLNYLGLRKNKRDGTEKGKRGIPLDINSKETCIVITHNHTDHMGNFRRQFKYEEDDELLSDLIIGCHEFFNVGNGIKENEDDKDKQTLHNKIMDFLVSGGFHIIDFNGIIDSSDQNRDSLVIGRRIGNDEAVILSGDQEPDRLMWAINFIMTSGAVPGNDGANLQKTVDHLMFKVPHHGSRNNNTFGLINTLSNYTNNIDFLLSSGKAYKHPDTKMYIDGNSLHKQGSFIEFNKELYNKNAISQDATELRTGQVFYTANLNKRRDEIGLGSIVYKSDGKHHVTYSKIYTDGSSNQEESYATEDDIDFMVSDILNNNYKSEQNEFFQLSVEEQIEEFAQMEFSYEKVRLFEKADVSQWPLTEDFFTDDDRHSGWGPKYFHIMGQICSPECLFDLFTQALEDNKLNYCKNVLKEVIIWQKEPIEFIVWLVNYIMKQNEVIVPTQPEKIGLDSTIIYEILCNVYSGEDNWLKVRIDLIKLMEPGYQIEFFSYWLTCGSLKPEEFVSILNELIEILNSSGESGDNILEAFEPELLHRYSACRYDILRFFEHLNIKRRVETASGRVNTVEPEEILYEPELNAYLNMGDLNFPIFVDHLTPMVFYLYLDNLVMFAFNTNEQNVAALLYAANEKDSSGIVLKFKLLQSIIRIGREDVIIDILFGDLLELQDCEEYYEFVVRNGEALPNMLNKMFCRISDAIEDIISDTLEGQDMSHEYKAYAFMAIFLTKGKPCDISEFYNKMDFVKKFFKAYAMLKPEKAENIYVRSKLLHIWWKNKDQEEYKNMMKDLNMLEKKQGELITEFENILQNKDTAITDLKESEEEFL